MIVWTSPAQMHTGNSLGALSPFHAVVFKVSNAAGTFIEQKPFFASVAYFMILKLLLDYLFVLELFLVRSKEYSLMPAITELISYSRR